MNGKRHQNDVQPQLNHCLLAHIDKEKFDEIDPNQIMSIFISSKEKRQAFFSLMFYVK